MHYFHHLFSLFLCSFLSIISFSQETRPNIIYIMADDMGYADLSCYGRKDYKTPNLDKLATQSVRFTNAYAAAPVCTPTRTAFMTGRYPAKTRIGLLEPWTPFPTDSAIGLSDIDGSIAIEMKNTGYETALIGKWHLGVADSFSPNRNGFDYFFGIKTGAADYINHIGNGGAYDLYENEKTVQMEGYITDLITSKTIGFLKQPHPAPFFLSLQYTAPHWPWQGPRDSAYSVNGVYDHINMSAGGSLKIFSEMMKSLDDGLGQVLKTLDETGLASNTLIIFTSDNGGEKFSDMGILKGKKMTVYEGGIRVPAIVKWPGKIAPGSISNQQVITMDWTATILAVAGVTNPHVKLDGINLLPFLMKEKSKTARTFYWKTSQRVKQYAVLSDNWKYIVNAKGEFLFDLQTDPGEEINLSNKRPAELKRLKKLFKDWEQTTLPGSQQ